MSQTPDLQTQVNALAARLAAIDGQGLQDPTTAFIPKTNKTLAGLREDLTQSVLTLESLLQAIGSKVNSLWTALSSQLGLPTQPPQAPDSEVPPAG